MSKSSNTRKRAKFADSDRKMKKRISPINSEKITYIDYKDVDLLKKFMSDRAKIKSCRVTGNTVQQQREVAKAIKNAREMGLISYTSRVTTQRRGRGDRNDRGDRGRDRGDRGDRNKSAESPKDESAAKTEVVETTTEAAETKES